MDYGYDQTLFVDKIDEQFECPICNNIARSPKECLNCGGVYCQTCIDSWIAKRKAECPKCRHDLKQNPVRPIIGGLLRIYNNINIKCLTKECGKEMKLCDYEAHLLICSIPKCYNHSICGKGLSQNARDKKVFQNNSFCDDACILLFQVMESKQDWKKVLELFQNYKKTTIPNVIPQNNEPNQPLVWKWDKVNIGTGIEVSNNCSQIYLQEAAYMFRTCIGDTPFFSGTHYWEIQLDQKTQNELKIGISTKKDFNMNSSFCDYEFGYAYYGLGQLRHNSNAAGQQYGRRFKNEGTLGVYLDMNNGTLSFAYNNEYFGIAFQNKALCQGPIYPAVSLLHSAGCKLITGKQVPQLFLRQQK